MYESQVISEKCTQYNNNREKLKRSRTRFEISNYKKKLEEIDKKIIQKNTVRGDLSCSHYPSALRHCKYVCVCVCVCNKTNINKYKNESGATV